MRQNSLLIVMAFELCVLPHVFADSSADFNEGLGYAKQLVGTVSMSLQQLDPGETIPNYTTNPATAAYYQKDMTKQTDTALKQDSQAKVQADDAGKTVMDDFATRRDPKLDPNSPMMKKSTLAITDADHIARGESDQYVDCRQDAKRGGIICGGEFYCMNGHCSEHMPEDNQQFAASTAQLSGVASGADDVKNDQGEITPHAFGGNAGFCAITKGGFKNCCSDKGWGKDIGLAHCSDGEKALGKAKENGTAVKVGKYCAHYIKYIVGKACVSYHYVFCVFHSKMAKTVQEQGRQAQLGKNFGSPKYPDCSGLTPDELQRLDFSRMDLSAVYDDIKNTTTFPKKFRLEVGFRKKD